MIFSDYFFKGYLSSYNIFNYFDDSSIIQRQPGGLFEIKFSALPPKEIEDIIGELKLTQFKRTSQVVNFGETAKKEFVTTQVPLEKIITKK